VAVAAGVDVGLSASVLGIGSFATGLAANALDLYPCVKGDSLACAGLAAGAAGSVAGGGGLLASEELASILGIYSLSAGLFATFADGLRAAGVGESGDSDSTSSYASSAGCR
jgi:hypothetical protein